MFACCKKDCQSGVLGYCVCNKKKKYFCTNHFSLHVLEPAEDQHQFGSLLLALLNNDESREITQIVQESIKHFREMRTQMIKQAVDMIKCISANLEVTLKKIGELEKELKVFNAKVQAKKEVNKDQYNFFNETSLPAIEKTLLIYCNIHKQICEYYKLINEKITNQDNYASRANGFRPIQLIKLVFSYGGAYSSIEVYKAQFLDGTELSVKQYTFEKPDFTADNFEIDIFNDVVEAEVKSSQMLSNYASYFRKFYGCFKFDEKSILVSEWTKFSLDEIIIANRATNTKFTKAVIRSITEWLIDAFIFMRTHGDYLISIKPQNILVTENSELKIAGLRNARHLEQHYSFSGQPEFKGNCYCYQKRNNEYLAPELLDPYSCMYSENEEAFVFSLGLIILRLATLENLDGLNKTENHEKLLDIVRI